MEEENEKEETDPDVPDKQRHQLKHRELFLSRQVETLLATHIRGKCSVTLLNETELLTSYLDKDVSKYKLLIGYCDSIQSLQALKVNHHVFCRPSPA